MRLLGIDLKHKTRDLNARERWNYFESIFGTDKEIQQIVWRKERGRTLLLIQYI